MKGLSYKNSLKESRKLLKKLNIEKERNCQMRNLNFNVQRRVCIAMALIGDIKVIKTKIIKYLIIKYFI